MKKMCMILLLLVSCSFVFAEDIKDTWYEMFADACEENLPKGASMRRHQAMRIIFMDIPLPIKSSSGFDLAAASNAFVKAVKGTEDENFIKKADIIVIVNYITTDYKIYSVVVSKKDF